MAAMRSGFTIGGVPPLSDVVAVAPYAVATSFTMRTSSRVRSVRAAAVVARIVPVRRARSGMMLDAVPALIVPTVTTPGCAGSSRRDTSVCSAVTMRRGRDDRVRGFVRARAVRAGAE